MKRIARRIRDARPLTVSLRVDGARGLSHLPAVVNEFRKWDTCVEATIRLFEGAERALRWRYPIGLCWEVEPGRPFAGRLPEGAGAVSFTPDGGTIAFLPEVVREFSETGVSVLHLPNVNAVRAVAERGLVPLPSAEAIAVAAEELAGAGVGLAGKRLVVHDYFLWRALREVFPDALGGRVEFSGCQAGTALAYVDWEGNVYPCESLPVRFGNLAEASFERIWDSPARRNLAQAIASSPQECAGCALLPGCLGGCRGLAYVAAGSAGAPDPTCPGRAAPGEPLGRAAQGG